MANKLLDTVYELNEAIQEVKGDKSTLLEALQSNEDFGKANTQMVLDILTDTAGKFPDVKTRIEAIESYVGSLDEDIVRIISNDLADLKRTILDAKGQYATVKEAIDHAGTNITVTTDDVNELSIKVTSESGVDSRDVNIAAGNTALVKLDDSISNYIMNILIQDSYASKIEQMTFNDSTVIKDSARITVDSSKGSQLAEYGVVEKLDLTGGKYTNLVGAYQQYEIDETCFKLLNSGVFVINQTPNTEGKTLDKIMMPYVSGKGASGTSYYKGKKSYTETGESIVIAFSNPVYIEKLIVYPYTVENTTNTYNIKCLDITGAIVFEDTETNPQPQGNRQPSAYVEHVIQKEILSVSITLGIGVSGTNAFLNCIEFWTKRRVVKESSVETVEHTLNADNLANMTSISITNSVNTNHCGIKYAVKANGVLKTYKPKAYKITWDNFLNKYGRQSPLSYIGYYNKIADVNGFGIFNMYYGKKVSVSMPSDVWDTFHNMSGIYMDNPYTDTSIYWAGLCQMQCNGSWSGWIDLTANQTYQFSVGGVTINCEKKQVARNMIRMVLTSPNSPLEGVAQLYHYVYPTTYSQTKGWYDYNIPEISRSIKIFHTYYNSNYRYKCAYVPGNLDQSTITYTNDSSYFYPTINNFRLPLTVYFYYGRDYDEFETAVKEDILYSLNSFSAGAYNRLLDKTTRGAYEPYIVRECTKGWEYLKFANINATGDIRYAISFDDGAHWYSYQYDELNEITIANIDKAGMTGATLMSIPASKLQPVISDYLSIAIMVMDQTSKFNYLTLDTGDDKFLPIDDLDLRYGGMRQEVLQTLYGGKLNGLMDVGDHDLKFSLKASLYTDDYVSPTLRFINFNIGAYTYWRYMTADEQNNISVRFDNDNVCEIENKMSVNKVFRLNFIKPLRASLIEKGSLQSLNEMINAVEEYKNTMNIEGLIVNQLSNQLTMRQNFRNSIYSDMNDTFLSLSVPFLQDQGISVFRDYYIVNSFDTDSLTHDAKVTYDPYKNRYTFESSTASYSTVMKTQESNIPADTYEIEFNFNIKPTPVKVEAIFNGDKVVNVTGKTTITIPEVINAIGEKPVKIAFQITSTINNSVYNTDILPKFTNSRTMNGFTITESTYYNSSYYPWYGVDDDNTAQHGWITQSGLNYGWMQFDLPTPKCVGQITISCGYYPPQMPKDFLFEAWNGYQWITLYSRYSEPAWSNYEKRTYGFYNDTAYTRYRINILNNISQPGYTGFGEFEMMEIDPSYIGRGFHGYFINFKAKNPFLGFGTVQIPIPYDGVSAVQIPLDIAALMGKSWGVKLNDITQVENTNYQMDYTTGKAILNWIDPNAQLKASDRLVVEILSDI